LSDGTSDNLSALNPIEVNTPRSMDVIWGTMKGQAAVPDVAMTLPLAIFLLPDHQVFALIE